MTKKLIYTVLVILLFGGFSLSFAEEGISREEHEKNIESLQKETTDSDMTTMKKKIRTDIDKLKELKESEKEKHKEKILNNAKKAAEKAVNSAIKKLNSIKERLDKMKVVSASEKSTIITKIDERIALLSKKLTEIEAATTKEEVHQILGASRKEIKDTREIVHAIVLAIHKTHLLNLIQKVENVIAKIEEKTKKLSEEKKQKVEAAVSSARTALVTAKELVDSGELKKAKEEIRKAHKALNGVMETIHGDRHTVEKEAENE